MEKAERSRWTRFDIAVPESLPAWRVTIPARDSTSVEIEYEIQWSGGSEGSTDTRDLRYFARPATLWAGPIREATFRLHLGRLATALLRGLPFNCNEGPVRLRVEPADATWTTDGLVWRRTNWEPDHDFRFLVDWAVEDYDHPAGEDATGYSASARRSTCAPSAASFSASASYPRSR